MRPDEAAVGLESSEIERNVRHRGRQDAAGRAARQIAFEGMAFRHAAAEFLDQFARRDAGGRKLDAGLPHTARHREAAKAFAFMTAL